VIERRGSLLLLMPNGSFLLDLRGKQIPMTVRIEIPVRATSISEIMDTIVVTMTFICETIAMRLIIDAIARVAGVIRNRTMQGFTMIATDAFIILSIISNITRSHTMFNIVVMMLSSLSIIILGTRGIPMVFHQNMGMFITIMRAMQNNLLQVTMCRMDDTFRLKEDNPPSH